MSVTASAIDFAGHLGVAGNGVTISQEGIPAPATLLPNGQIALQFPSLAYPAPYADYFLQQSTNLVDWITVKNLGFSAAGVLQVNINPAGNQLQFYRVGTP